MLLMNSVNTGELPSAFGQLRKLVVLSLSCNLFSGQIPESIGSMEKLECLELADNEFDGMLPMTLSKLSNVRICDVENDTKLSGAIPLKWVQSGTLKKLNTYNSGVDCSGFGERIISFD